MGAEEETYPTTAVLLTHLEKKIEEDKNDESEDTNYYEIIRDLLLSSDDDEVAVSKAVHQFFDNYIAGFSREDFGMRKPPEYAAGGYLNSLSNTIFDAARYVLFSDMKHERLAQLLICVKTKASPEFTKDNPKFVYYGWGLELTASECWNASRVGGWTQDSEWRTAEHACNCWISIAALLAKLYKAGLLDEDGPRWLSGDFRDCFTHKQMYDPATNIGRQAQLLATANHILIAGDVLVKEVKRPSRKWWFELSAESWKFWASKLQEAADSVGNDARWNLKSRAQEAHDRMVELYPEAFKGEVMAESEAAAK